MLHIFFVISGIKDFYYQKLIILLPLYSSQPSSPLHRFRPLSDNCSSDVYRIERTKCSIKFRYPFLSVDWICQEDQNRIKQPTKNNKQPFQQNNNSGDNEN